MNKIDLFPSVADLIWAERNPPQSSPWASALKAGSRTEQPDTAARMIFLHAGVLVIHD
jgi:hypothetical protein